MTNTWHRHVTYWLQANDFIEYFYNLLATKDLAKAKWALDWHPYVSAVLATYGYAKIDDLKEKLKKAIDNPATL